jgi:hypothetical protein
MLLISGVFLVYTAIVVPAQIFVWNYSDPCNPFPTLRLDIFIDTFFMVNNSKYLHDSNAVKFNEAMIEDSLKFCSNFSLERLKDLLLLSVIFAWP